MTTYTNLRRRSAALAATFMLATGIALSACGSVTDTLLDVEDPDLISQPNVNSAEGALALQRGALDRFRNITGGAESGMPLQKSDASCSSAYPRAKYISAIAALFVGAYCLSDAIA